MKAKLTISFAIVVTIGVKTSLLGLILKGVLMLKSIMAVLAVGVAQVRMLGSTSS